MKFQRQGHLTNWVRILQILLATISLALSIAVVATAAHTYHLFHSQRGANNSWWLPLWPGHFDTTGTKAYIGTASAVAFLSLVFLAAGVIPATCSSIRPRLSTLITVTGSIISILLAVAAIVFNDRLDKSVVQNRKDSIRSWTCKFKQAKESSYGVSFGGTSATIGNNGFVTICNETVFDFWAMVSVLALQSVLLISVGLQRWRHEPQIGENTKATTSDLNLS